MADTKKGRKPKQQNRGHGEGSIYQRPDNTWAGVSRYQDTDTGKTKKHFVYGKTRPEVVTKKAAWESEYKAGLLPSKKKTTVSGWLDTWMETYKKNSIRQNTYENYKIIVDTHLKPALGDIVLKDLLPQQVQKMINDKLAGGRTRDDNIGSKGGPLSHRMVEYIFSILRQALQQALKNGLVIRNVCDAVDRPKKEKHEFTPWTAEQTSLFIKSLKGSRLFSLYVTEWATGLRRSEILGLQWPDIDLKRGTLSVKRSLVRVKGGYIFGEPKTKKSRRTIPLPQQATQTLRSWRAKQAQEKVKWNADQIDIPEEERPVYNPLNMVFIDEVGQPLKPDFISISFKRDLQAAKLPNIRFHDLRHGHATMLLELGEDLKVISERLGHSSITMTGDTYSHVREKMQKEASNKLNLVLQIK